MDKQQEKIIKKYVIHGIPMSSIKNMCKDLNISEKKLMNYISGQTMAVIGNEGILYEHDVIRFIKGLPIND